MATFDTTLLDEPAPRGARIVALSLLSDLRTERDRLHATHDIDALHDFRVALRRLRSWLGGLRSTLRGSVPRGVQKRLRRIAKASNAGRDAEVFLGWLGGSAGLLPARRRTAATWLMTRFERQHREADASLDELLVRDFAGADERLQARLESYRVEAHIHGGMQEPTLAVALAALLREHGEQLQQRLALIHSKDEAEATHRARIGGKRLRYILEPVAPHIEGGEKLLERLKVLQDSLGDLHDAHMWLVMLGEMAAEAALDEGKRLAHMLSEDDRGRRERFPSLGGFALLARLAQQHATDAYEQFAEAWDKRRARRFFRDLDAACSALEARPTHGVEIERKFLLSGRPNAMPRVSTSHILQGYLPGQRLVERLRAERRGSRTRYYRTVKSGLGIVRSELEEETSLPVFETMWPLTEGRRLTKLRHRVPDGELTWEVDEFPEMGLVMAEVELPSATAPVVIPAWLEPFVAREVTGDPAYLNSNLAH